MICAFTGHRPSPKLGGYQPNPIQAAVIQAIREKLIELRPSAVISGMALGVDQWATQVCIDLGIPFTAAVPFKGQEAVWPRESQQVWRDLLSRAAKVIYVCDGGRLARSMQRRNEWMSNHCDRLVAVWDGSDGGTANCVNYHRIRHPTKPIENLWLRIQEILKGV